MIPSDSLIPPLYSQEELGYEAIAYIKLFMPWSKWTWYLTEFNPNEKLAFGLIAGNEIELGYVSIEELEEVIGPGGLKIEQDRSFIPKTLKEVYEELVLQRMNS